MVAPQAYAFGPYRLEGATRRLLRRGEPISLTPKAFDTLLALIERRDRVVEKTELMQLIWQGSFVEEANLSQTIFVLRKILGADIDGHPFIETVPRRGYRFVMPVTVEQPREDAGIAPTSDTAGTTDRRPSGFIWLVAAIAGGLLVLLGGLEYRRMPPAGALPDRKVMLAVLPFDNLSADPEQEYFSSGLTEEMITQLGALEPERLGVIARVSTLESRRARKDALQIATDLGVDYILEGSVRRDGSRVRIAARLIQVRDRSHLWAEEYDRDLRDILDVQSEVASAIAQQVRLKLTPEQNARLRRAAAVNPDAFENYLRGRFFWNKRTVDGYQRAIAFFEKAIAVDPSYAKAYAGLADAYALLGSAPNVVLSRGEAMSRARDAAQKALAIDETLADAHTSLGFVKMHYDWEFRVAEREFERGIALNPGYATAHHWYAYDLVALGRLDDAIAEVQRAQKADPLSVIISRDVGEMLLFAGRDDEAIAQCQKTLEMDPTFGLAHWTLALGYQRKGQAAASLEELRKAAPTPGPSIAGLIYVRTGRTNEARRVLEELERGTPTRYEINTEIAGLSVALGDTDGAFAALERSFRERDGGLIVMAVAPEWQPLWTDPRFADLMRRVGVTWGGHAPAPAGG